MYRKSVWIVVMMFALVSCNRQMEPISSDSPGFSMLLIGNSFFRPYAENLKELAKNAGYDNHQATVVFRGGDNGRPINFWEATTSDEHLSIKAALDQGNIEYFGMTAGNLPDNPTDGFRDWIEYAVQSNPDIIIVLSIPSFDFPVDWDQLVEDNGFNTVEELYEYFVGDRIHKNLVDELRAEFPSTTIFTIPTGWAAIQLSQMNENNALEDDILMFGPKANSIFTDDKGHQGQIVIETGTLLWLNSIYQVDLQTDNYNTGFQTDLHEIAQQIMDNHDPNYKQ